MQHYYNPVMPGRPFNCFYKCAGTNGNRINDVRQKKQVVKNRLPEVNVAGGFEH
jgi:hypothetical protein